MNVTLRLSHNALVDGLQELSYSELIDVILAIDLAKADVEFTERLVTGLVESLRNDKEDVSLKFIDWDKV